MIKVISGTCRTSLGLKTSQDTAFRLHPAEEQRLIDRKVAVRVYQEVLLEPVATPSDTSEDEGADVNSPEEKPSAQVEETALNLDSDQLKTMKLDQLKKLARDMGIATTGLRSKDEYAAAIAGGAAVVEPKLSVEDPVE